MADDKVGLQVCSWEDCKEAAEPVVRVEGKPEVSDRVIRRSDPPGRAT